MRFSTLESVLLKSGMERTESEMSERTTLTPENDRWERISTDVALRGAVAYATKTRGV